MTAKPKAVAGGYSAKMMALLAFLEKKRGVAEVKASANASMYKVADKIFAIVSKKTGYVVLKTQPESVPMLKEMYKGVGHKTHLDKRHWIAVELDADVPMKEVQRLVSLSYDLVLADAKSKRKAKKVAKRAR